MRVGSAHCHSAFKRVFFDILLRLTHAFNALRFGINTMLFTKFSTAVISIITALALLVLIPGVLSFLNYTKALEEEVLTEPDPTASPEVKAYFDRFVIRIQSNVTDKCNA